MRNRIGRIGSEGIRFSGTPLGLADPRHPSIASDVADVMHVQLPESEVAEVSVVRGVRMRGQECGTRGTAIVLDARARSEKRDPSIGERVWTAGLCHHQ